MSLEKGQECLDTGAVVHTLVITLEPEFLETSVSSTVRPTSQTTTKQLRQNVQELPDLVTGGSRL
jgi:hypothetical protein